MAQTLDQQRAAYAWTVVQHQSKDYVNIAKSAGALIMSNGLMATLAYYKDKDKDHHKALLSHIMGWLQIRKLATGSEFKEVMLHLQSLSSQQYMAASQESLDLLRWLRQLAPTVNGEE